MRDRSILMIGLALAMASPAPAQEAAKVPERGEINSEMLLKSLNLPAGKRLWRTKDGCHTIWDSNEGQGSVGATDFQWSGACPYGLADGAGTWTTKSGPSAKFGLMGSFSFYEVALDQGKSSAYETDKANGGLNVYFNELTRDLTPYYNAPGEWLGNVKLTSDIDKSTELLGRYIVNCLDLSPDGWNQTTKQEVESLKEALKGCKKIAESKSGAKRAIRMIEHRITNAAGVETQRNIYPCAFHVDKAKEDQLDNSACNNHWVILTNAIKPRVEERIARSKAQHEKMLAAAQELRRDLPGRYQAQVALAKEAEQQLALAEQQRLQAEEQRKAALTAAIARELPERHARFLETPFAKMRMPAAVKAPAPFAKPADTSTTGVIVMTAESGPQALRFETSELALLSDIPVESMAFAATEERFNLAVERLKKAGAQTVYIIDLRRYSSDEFGSNLVTRTQRIMTSSTTNANPLYNSLLSQLESARAEENAASQANTGGGFQLPTYSGNTAQKIMQGLQDYSALNAANRRYKEAKRQRESIERQLQGVQSSTTSQTFANVTFGTLDIQAFFEGRLAVFACSMGTGMCSEKERRVTHEGVATFPVLAIPSVQNLAAMQAQSDKANAALFGGLGKKTAFGFTGEDIGNFLNGTVQDLPLATMHRYMSYAAEDFESKLDARFPKEEAENRAVDARLRALGREFAESRVPYEDLNGFIEDAIQAEADERNEAAAKERKKNLQSLGD